MGNLLWCFSFVTIDQWIDDEDATFYIPESVPLTVRQTLKLQRLGVSQGEAFIISKSGTLEKPSAKLFKVEANARLFDLCNNSITFFEDFPGQFSMEFEYHLADNVIAEIEICFQCKNSSSNHSISVVPCTSDKLLYSWGRHTLAPTATSSSSAGVQLKTHKWSSRPLGLYAEHYHLVSLGSAPPPRRSGIVDAGVSHKTMAFDCALLLTVTDLRPGSRSGSILVEGLFFRIAQDQTGAGTVAEAQALPVVRADAATSRVDAGSLNHSGAKTAAVYYQRKSAPPITATCIDHLFLVDQQGTRRVYSKLNLFGSQALHTADDDHCSDDGNGRDAAERSIGEGGVKHPSSSSSSEEEDRQCVICLSVASDTIVFPCKHLCLCSACSITLSTASRHMKKCPVCRVHIICMLQLKQ